mmetsp:Transcript_40154/g.115913  ORF Transcript_40154/g.115913 Transcript_40154/m.115913 type:complete len:84 (+) Transcript_40154:312-563(+)
MRGTQKAMCSIGVGNQAIFTDFFDEPEEVAGTGTGLAQENCRGSLLMTHKRRPRPCPVHKSSKATAFVPKALATILRKCPSEV